MAKTVRRYCVCGVSDRELQTFVESASVRKAFSTDNIDVEVDDGIEGIVDALDEYMLARGFYFVTKDPPAATELRVRSPDGSTWLLTVDDAGAISTRKKTDET